LIALRELNLTEFPEVIPMCDSARRWLLTVQNDDGGWGAAAGMASSIEETAFAVEALAGVGYVESVRRGVAWLVENTRSGKVFQASPIGLYFAKLWFSEELYPLVFAVSALARAERHMQGVR
jgi:squalene-hopene/tetraprenyl-beta-curcumene cyclase